MKFNTVIGGDIFNTDNTDTPVVIAHGVNVKGVTGGFAALVFGKIFPETVPDYLEACHDGFLTPGRTQIVPTNTRNVFVANIASQENPGADARLEWLVSGLDRMYVSLNRLRSSVEVRLPLIGGGIGGIDPIQAADAIRLSAKMASNGINTSLYLLENDPHTAEVVEWLGRFSS